MAKKITAWLGADGWNGLGQPIKVAAPLRESSERPGRRQRLLEIRDDDAGYEDVDEDGDDRDPGEGDLRGVDEDDDQDMDGDHDALKSFAARARELLREVRLRRLDPAALAHRLEELLSHLDSDGMRDGDMQKAVESLRRGNVARATQLLEAAHERRQARRGAKLSMFDVRNGRDLAAWLKRDRG